ncbi:MAG: hypothetical protein IK131_06645 [Paludibacteraceae bacterium]|nr:hypothetical protein [Paludibacteraceae bacterium]
MGWEIGFLQRRLDVGDVPWEMLLLCSPQVCDGSSLSANRVSYRMTLVCFLIERQYVDAGGALA